MACEDLNKSLQEIEDLINNKRFNLNLDEDSNLQDKFNALEFFNKNLYIPDEDNPNNRYYIGETKVEGRVSDAAKRNFEKKFGKEAAERMNQSPVNSLKKDSGITVHNVLQDVVDNLTKKQDSKSLNQIIQNGKAGEYGVVLNTEDINNLISWGQNFLKRIEGQQKLIDPNGEFRIFTEQKILDPKKNRGGAIDVLVVYSDHSASIYDYKTSTPRSFAVRGKGSKARLVDNLATEGKIESYDLTISDYKRILKENFGITHFRELRAIPVHIQLAKEEGKFIGKLDLVQIGEQASKYLMEIPVAGETTSYKGIDNLLEKQMALVNQLELNVKEKRFSKEEKQVIRARINRIRKAIRTTIVKGQVNILLNDGIQLVQSFEKLLSEPETLENGQPNPRALDLDQIKEFLEEVAVYEGIAENTTDYIEDLHLVEPETSKNFVLRRAALADKISYLKELAKQKQASIILDKVFDNYKDKDGNLVPLSPINYITRNFLNLSEINHPIFQAFNDLKNESHYDVIMQMREFNKSLDKYSTELYKWGKSVGLSKKEVYNKLMNKNTGNLYSKLTKEFWNEREEAFINEDSDWLIEKYEFKDLDQFKKEYKERLEDYQNRLKARLNNLQDVIDQTTGNVIRPAKEFKQEYNKQLKIWKSKNDLATKKKAYLNRYNYPYLKLKPEYENQYKSEEFSYIESHKPLLDYYNFFTGQIENFREMLGLSYSEIPTNFVPKIRKQALEHLIENGDVSRTFKEIYKDLISARQEDVHIQTTDPKTGEPLKSIPKLFIQPFRSSDGRVDTKEQSNDLSRTLVLFSKMAYNYEAMSNLEAQTTALKDLLGDPSTRQGGEAVTDIMGNLVKGNFKDPLNRATKETSTYQLFEKITDYYLYGIKFKEGSISKHFNSTKTLLSLKQYMSRKALAFAVIPGIGAFVAGKINSRLESMKKQSYTPEQAKEAYRHFFKDFHKYRAMNEFFHAYAEDESDKMVSKITSNKVVKYTNDRYLFSPLRGADEKLTEHVLVSMAQNYGIDIEGKFGKKGRLIRLNKPGIDTTGIKSLWETSTYDQKTGEFSVENINKEAFIQFRSAVKATMNNIIGNMSSEDIGSIDLNLGLNLMMHFKTWMPGILKERFGNLTYDRYIQSLRQGRYKAYFSTYRTTEEVQNGTNLGYFMRKVIVPNMGKLALDVMTFGFSNKSYNPKLAKLQYYKWKEENPEVSKEVTEEEFLEMKRGQIKAMINEVRAIMLFFSIITYLGSDGDGDGEPLYADNKFTRTMYKAFAKSYSELSFAWTPREFIRLVSNPLPISQLLEDASYTIKNTFDEGRDLMFGENSPQDKSPLFYYTSQWAYGGTQLARLFEIFEIYKRADYLN